MTVHRWGSPDIFVGNEKKTEILIKTLSSTIKSCRSLFVRDMLFYRQEILLQHRNLLASNLTAARDISNFGKPKKSSYHNKTQKEFSEREKKHLQTFLSDVSDLKGKSYFNSCGDNTERSVTLYSLPSLYREKRPWPLKTQVQWRRGNLWVYQGLSLPWAESVYQTALKRERQVRKHPSEKP